MLNYSDKAHGNPRKVEQAHIIRWLRIVVVVVVVMIGIIYIYWAHVPGAVAEDLTNILFNYYNCLI